MSYRVLLIDDNQLALESMEKTIPWAEHDLELVGCASNGIQGCQMIRSLRPDILISDIQMPEMDGLTMLEQMKNELANSRVIFITAYDKIEYAARAIRLSAFDFLMKPVKNEDLIQSLDRAVQSMDRENSKIEKQAKEQTILRRARFLSALTAGSMEDIAHAFSGFVTGIPQNYFFVIAETESHVTEPISRMEFMTFPENVLPLSELHDFPNHPFKVRDDEAMQETTESIRQYGVLVPAIVRPREDGGYEIIAGHRRRHGSELAGLSAMPCIVRQMDDDTATILMVDSNIQRENILPSERAQAYKMKLEAIRRKAGRPAKTEEKDVPDNSVQVGQNFDGKTSRELLAENSPDSSTQIQRYIRLTELTPELQQMVDEKKIGMTPAVEISYLKPEEQQMLLTAIDSEQATPSLSQAQRMKKLSRDGKLNDDTMLDIMMEQKKPEGYNVVLSADKLRKYFPRSYTPQKMEETILKLLDAWLRKRQRDQSR